MIKNKTTLILKKIKQKQIKNSRFISYQDIYYETN